MLGIFCAVVQVTTALPSTLKTNATTITVVVLQLQKAPIGAYGISLKLSMPLQATCDIDRETWCSTSYDGANAKHTADRGSETNIVIRAPFATARGAENDFQTQLAQN